MSVQAAPVPAHINGLLVPLAAHGLAGSRFDLPKEPFASDDWFLLVQICRSLGLLGMLAVAGQRGDVTLSPAQAEELAVLEAEAAGLSLLVEQRVVRLSALLAAAGVAHRLLGAPPRARLGYRQPGVRTFETATMLVEPSGLELAVPWGVAVERVLRLPGGRMIGVGDLAQPPRQLAVADHPVPTASPEEHLVLACLDVAQVTASRNGTASPVASGPGLVAQRDVAELALSKEIDTARVQQTAEAWGVVNPVARALAEVWELFGLADRTRLSVWAHRIADPPAPAVRTAAGPPAPPGPAPRVRSSMVNRVVRKVHRLSPSKVVARAAARRSTK